MSRKNIIVLSFMLLLAVIIIANRDHKVDWTPTFNDIDTKPLDTKVFFDQLPTWFDGNSSKRIHTTFYEYDQYLRGQPVDSIKSYVSISNDYEIDRTSFEALLTYVAYGNDAFISARTFPYFMKDTLGFETDNDVFKFNEKPQTLQLQYAKDTISFTPKMQFGTSYLKDTTTIKKLGSILTDKGKKHTNFVGIPYYDGVFYVHTTPEIFTNYQMLEADDTNYLNTVISYLPNVPILLDKVVKGNPEFSQSPLRYILSKEPLKWSWYLLLLTIGLFMLFKAKRTQRIMPVILPVKNTTTEFVHTVSNLHYEAKDYNGIVQKMIIHFLEHVRSTYHLRTEHLDENFIKKLALKSGNSIEQIQRLITLIVRMKSHNFQTKEPLITLNKEIEEFYKTDKN